MDPKKTAVVLIEYQNDFTSEGGTLHHAVKPVMDSTNMLANTVETVEKARDHHLCADHFHRRLPRT
jgi:ureidoacrylate peracid hydrolase